MPVSRSSTSLSRRVDSKVAEGDIRGAIKVLSSSESLAKEDEYTYKKLLEKHPSPHKPMNFPDKPNVESLCVSEKEVRLAILSFPNGSSSGVDGLRPQHLKDLISPGNGDAAATLLFSLTKFCNFVLSGNIHNSMLPLFYGATLCALNKKDGGIRPIAVGNTLRRLVGKLACSAVRNQTGDYLRPLQLGFATKRGCEAIVHATRTFLDVNKNSSKVLLKIDYKNAFNTIHRDAMLSSVKEIVPCLFAFLWQAYAYTSQLFYGDWTIPSVSGCQQGDPTGPLLFCLTLQPILKHLISEYVSFYLDDGTLGGEPNNVLEDFKSLVQKCKEIGLEINSSKCELYFCGPLNPDILRDFDILSPGIKVISEVSLLGAPITDGCCDSILANKLEEINLLTERLCTLKSYHVAFFLLKNCLAIPKLTYILRTTPLWNHKRWIQSFDCTIKSTTQHLINCIMDEKQYMFASLPVRFGGLGVRKLADIYMPAFLSSLHGALELVCLMLNLSVPDKLKISGFEDGQLEWEKLNLPLPSNIPPDALASQSFWDNINIKSISERLNIEDGTERAIYLALLMPESNAWINTLPSRAIGTLLDNNTFRIAMGLRLRTKICHPHTCICGDEVDCYGRHGLSCSKSLGRYSRHQEINQIISRSLASAKIPSRLEPPGLSREDGKRVDGMTLIPWEKGKCLVWDATCTDTLAPSHISVTEKDAGAAAKKAALAKRKKYSTITDHNFTFLPFAVETFGPWCEEAIEFTNKLGGLLALFSGEPRSRSFLVQRIGIAIQKGNAVSVMGTFQPSRPLSEVFYILD